jgi:hypothetical protein
MVMSWRELLKINYGVLLSELNLNVLSVLNEAYFKIENHKYVFAYEAEKLGAITYCGFVWVASDGIAEWILTKNSQADDGVNIRPPDCLLPEPKMTGYQSLVDYGKKTDPENFGDYVIGQCQVSFNDFTYYFRRAMPSKNDYPIGIKVDLRPWKNLKAA